MNLIRLIPAKGSGQDTDYPVLPVFRPQSRLSLPERTSGFFYLRQVMAIQIIVNGVAETVPACTIAELVKHKGLLPGALVIERNQQIVKQEEWSSVRLQEQDRLELLSFVGGG
jgi:sulfur carrier protein